MSREYGDITRAQAVQTELHKAISETIVDNGIRCVLDVQGKTERGIDIDTGEAMTASQSLTLLVKEHLSSTFAAMVSMKTTGPRPGSVIATHSAKGKDGAFEVEALQIRFGHEERHSQRDKVVSAIAELVALINGLQKTASPPRAGRS